MVRTIWESHGIGMDTSSPANTANWSFVVDSVPKACSATNWASAYELDISYSGVVPAVDGYISFNTLDPDLIDTSGRIGYAPRTLQFYP